MGEIRAGLRSTGSAPKHIPCGLVGGRDCVVCAVIPNCGDLLRYGCIRMGRASCNPLRANGALYRDALLLLFGGSGSHPGRLAALGRDGRRNRRVRVGLVAGTLHRAEVAITVTGLGTTTLGGLLGHFESPEKN